MIKPFWFFDPIPEPTIYMMVNGWYAQVINYMFVCKLLNSTMVLKYNKTKTMHCNTALFIATSEETSTCLVWCWFLSSKDVLLYLFPFRWKKWISKSLASSSFRNSIICITGWTRTVLEIFGVFFFF